MIQRIQSVWLLLAAVCAVLMFIWPLYGGTSATGIEIELRANKYFVLMLVTGLVTILSFLAIFIFKNRSTQGKVVWLTLLLDIGLGVLTYVFSSRFATENNFVSGGYKIASILPIVIFVLLILAWRGISADNKLIKSVDRLRN
jgi:hypothetical protein